jgi:O-antigen/teichoic acid export membrane protein
MQSIAQLIKHSLSSLGSYGFFLAASAVISQHLSHEAFGDYRVAIRTLLLLRVITLFGMDRGVLGFLKYYMGSSEYKTFYNWVLRSLQKNIVIVTCILILTVLIGSYITNLSLEAYFMLHPVLLAVFFAPLLSFSIVYSNVLVAYNRLSTSYIITQVIPAVIIISSITVLFYGYGLAEFNVYNMLGIYLLSASLVLFTLYLLTRSLVQKTKDTVSSENVVHWKKHTRAFFASSVSSMLRSILGLWVLEAISTEANVGRYAILLLTGSLINVGCAPVYSQLSTQVKLCVNDTEGLKNLIVQANQRTAVISIVLGCILIIGAKYVLLMFGSHSLILREEYILNLLLSIVWTYLVNAQAILNYTHYSKEVAWIKALTVPAEAVCLYFLVSYAGLIGAIFGYTLPSMISCLYMSYKSNKLLGVNTLRLR